MSKLTIYNCCYCELEFEKASIGFLENAGWQYTGGNDIHPAKAKCSLRRISSSMHEDMESEENHPTVLELQDFLNDLMAIQAGTWVA